MKRYKTVELLIAERDWDPPHRSAAGDRIVGVRVAFSEKALRDRLKHAGAIWNPAGKVWQLRYDRVVALGFKGRIVADVASDSGCRASRDEHADADAHRHPDVDASIHDHMPASRDR